LTKKNTRQEFSNPRDAIQRARETLQRLEAADRERALERQLQPVDDLAPVEPMPVDYRDCKSTKDMTVRQYAQYCEDGKPPLQAPVTVPKAKVAALVRAAVDRERANMQASFEAFAEILGEEVAVIEKRMRADFKAEFDKLRAEIRELKFGDAGVLDLPDWKSYAAH
jgi:hypothetical protein